MKILIVHNEYGRPSGEEAAIAAMCTLLDAAGHQVERFTRTSATIPTMRWGRMGAFMSGIHSPQACRDFQQCLNETTPDLVNVHNLYPLISPSVLPICTNAHIPVVMTVHNYRLLCPNGLFYSHGEPCERCMNGREWWCIVRNCEANMAKSVGYALRNATARWRRLFREHVTLFAVLTEFQKNKLIAGGLPESRIRVVGNGLALPENCTNTEGTYIAYAGRISPEKGIDILLDVARRLPHIPFRVAGQKSQDVILDAEPDNVEFVGMLPAEAMATFYANARMVVLPSRCYEGLPMALIEAMGLGKAVIGPRHGGIPEVIDDDISGLLFESENVFDLERCITTLWEQPDRCREMGVAARAKARRQFSTGPYLDRLISALETAVSTASEAPQTFR